MCRLAYLPNPEVLGNELSKLFSYLNKAQGGNGMGASYFTDKGMVVKKGAELSAEELAKDIEEAGYPAALFHARAASSGYICDSLCHPFATGEKSALVHNGHFSNWESAMWGMAGSGKIDMADMWITSDTWVIAKMIELFG